MRKNSKDSKAIRKDRMKKGIAFSLATISSIGVLAPAVMDVAEASPSRYDSVAEYIMRTWKNYPAINHPNFDAGWGFRDSTLYTTKNIHWTGYYNKDAIRTTDGTYEFKVRLTNGHRDPYGWTFRHNEIGSNRYSFYAVEIGPYHNEITLAKINSWIPSASDPTHGGPLYHGTISSADGHYNDHGGGDRKSNALSHVDGDVLDYAPINYSPTSWADIKIENIGNRIKVWYNGQLKIDYVDRSPLINGGYGPYTASQYEAEYKDISVNGVNFLNIPPEIIVQNGHEINRKEFAPGGSIPVRGYAEDYDGTKGMEIFYSIDGGYGRQGAKNSGSTGKMNFDFNANIPSYLGYGYHSLEVWAQDGEKAESAPNSYMFFVKDIKAPTVNISGNPISWTKNDVLLSVESFDYESGVKRIQLPNGTWVNSSKAQFSVSANGSYSFIVEDNAGNKATKTIIVNRIDKIAPSTPYVNSSLAVTSTDYESGLKEIRYKINGSQWQSDVDLKSLPLGEYRLEIQAIDKVGNMSDIYEYDFAIETIPDTTIRDAVEKAERERTQSSVDYARGLVNKMEASSEKTEYIGRLDNIQVEINNGVDIEEQLRIIRSLIENAVSLEDVSSIQDLINKLPSSPARNNVQVMLNNKKAEIINRINYEKALEAVMEAEEVRTQQSVDNARHLVNKLPNSQEKEDLIERINAIQNSIYQDNSNLKDINDLVNNAEEVKTQSAVDEARAQVNTLPEGEDKDSFNSRLDEVQKIIDNQNIMDKIKEIETILSNKDVSYEDIIYAEGEFERILSNTNYIPTDVDAFDFEYRVVHIEELLPIAKENVVENAIEKAREEVEIAEFDRDEESIKRAETQIDYANTVVDGLIGVDHENYDSYKDQIKELEDRLELVKAETGNNELLEAQRLFAKAQEKVEIAEETIDRTDILEAKKSITTAEDAIKSLDQSEDKDELLEGIESLKNRISILEKALKDADELKKNEVLDKILDYDKSKDILDKIIAQEGIDALENIKDKVEMQDLLDRIITTVNSPSFNENMNKNYAEELGLIRKYGKTELEEDRIIAQDAVDKVKDKEAQEFLQNVLDNILKDGQLGDVIDEILGTEIVEEDYLEISKDLIEELKNQIEELEKNPTQQGVNVSKDLIEEIKENLSKVPESGEKLEVEIELGELEQIVDEIENELRDNDYDEAGAIEAVEDAEIEKTQNSVDKAKDLVDKLPEGSTKDDLKDRLDKVQAEIDNSTSNPGMSDEYANGKYEELLEAVEDLQKNQNIYEYDKVDRLLGEMVDKILPNLADGATKDKIEAGIPPIEDILARFEEYVKNQSDEDKAIDSVISAERDKTQDAVDYAKDKVEILPEGSLKDELEDRLDDVQAEIDRLDKDKENQNKEDQATDAVEKAESDKTQDSLDRAKDKVEMLPDSSLKDQLEDRLDKVQAEIDRLDKDNDKESQNKENQATDAVKKAESDKTQNSLDKAKDKVEMLPEGSLKDQLENRLDKVQAEIDKSNKDNNNKDDSFEIIVYPKGDYESDKDNEQSSDIEMDVKIRLPYTTKPLVEVENGYTIINGKTNPLEKAIFNKEGVYQITFKTNDGIIKEKISVIDIKEQSIQFSDIENHWGEKYINQVAQMGIANGMPDKKFNPNSSINVADTFTFLDRTLLLNNKYLKAVNRENVKEYNVAENHWAYYTVSDIISRMKESTLDYMFEGKNIPMDKNITREELAQIIYEISDNKFTVDYTTASFNSFEDFSFVDYKYQKAMEYCVSTGMIVGRDNNNLAPKANLTRAELITVIQRLNNKF